MPEVDLPDDNSADVALMLRVRNGDRQAFRELVERHQHRVVGTVARMLGAHNDAEDIAQQVFLRVWNSAARYQPTAKFTTWLMTITRNLVFNETRRRSRTRTVPLDRGEGEGEIDLPDTSTKGPADQLLQQELALAVDTAILSLPEPQRMAVVLRRYENMPYEEIADVLKVSVSAVKSLLFRARTELKQQLSAYLDDSPPGGTP